MPEPVDLELCLRGGGTAAGGTTAGAYSIELRVRRGDDTELRRGPYPASLALDELHGLTGQAAEYGAALSAAIFGAPGLWAAFSEERGRAFGLGAALRVRLLVDASTPELHGVCWELLGDPGGGIPFSLNERIHFSRFFPARVDAAALPPKPGSLRALAAAANPSNLSAYKLERINVSKELDRAEAGLAPIRVDRLPAFAGDLCTLPRLLERARGVDILFLACHAAYRRRVTALFLEGEDGRVKRATGAELCQQIQGMENRPRLVVLAACETAGSGTGEALSMLGTMLADAGVPAVVAMQGPVGMDTLDAFLPPFFRELALDGRIDRALSVARRVIGAQPDWWSPVLLMNLLSGRLWEVRTAPDEPAVDPLSVPHEVPAPPPNFIGRDVELAELQQAVEAGQQVINIHGTNGVGKTATARELVRRLQERFPGGQVNLDLQGSGARAPVTAAQALAYVIQKFDPSIAQLPSDETLLRGRFQSLLYRRRALILLDNAADLAQVAPFLPPPEGCLLILTTWERLESEDAAITNRLLGKLSAADAARLLVHLAPRTAPRAAELAERCEYLPQALDGIARRLNKSPNLTLEDLFGLLDDVEERLEITGVAAMLQMSYDMLSDSQKRDWRRLSVFAADFDVAAAAWLWGRVDDATAPERLRSRIIRARLDLEDLVGCGLVERDLLKDRYLLHNLERIFAAGLDDLTDEEERAGRLAHARYYLSVLARANALYLQGSQRVLDGLTLFDREAREIRAAWAWLQAAQVNGALDPACGELLARYPGAFANLMAVRLMPEERIRWLTAGRAAARVLGDRALEVTLSGSLGVAYYVMDRYPEALACQAEALQGALAEARRPLESGGESGANCSGLVRVLGNLGALFRVQGKNARAIRYLEKQLELARRFGMQRDEGRALGTLGRVYLDMRDTARAIEYYQAELAITELTGDRRARGIALGGLADAYRVLKNFTRAQQLLEEDIAITREIGDRRGQAIASWMLGKVFNDQGDLAKAVEWMQVLVDYEREIGHQDATWHAEKVADLQSRLRGE